MTEFTVRPATEDDLDEWVAMRLALFPDHTAAEFRTECVETLSPECHRHAWIAHADDGARIGFIEIFIRNYAEDCTGDTPYVEEIWVAEAWRKSGVARALVGATEDWARAHGYDEMGSDTWLHDANSQRWHAAMGFEEVERIVVFRKGL